MTLQIPSCVTMPSQFKNELVTVDSTSHVHYLNVVWVLAHLTARLKCEIFSNGKSVFEAVNSSGLKFKDAIDLLSSKKNDAISIRHGASRELGGVTLQRVDEDRWVLDVMPAISRNAVMGEVQEVNHICRELFLSIKHAVKWDDEVEHFRLTYRQPIYFHPRFETKDFDPSYFTVD